jgi:hypothetical protein
MIRARLDNFYQQTAASDAAEAHRLAATIERSDLTVTRPPEMATRLHYCQPFGDGLGPVRLPCLQPRSEK